MMGSCPRNFWTYIFNTCLWYTINGTTIIHSLMYRCSDYVDALFNAFSTPNFCYFERHFFSLLAYKSAPITLLYLIWAPKSLAVFIFGTSICNPNFCLLLWTPTPRFYKSTLLPWFTKWFGSGPCSFQASTSSETISQLSMYAKGLMFAASGLWMNETHAVQITQLEDREWVSFWCTT